MRHVIDESEASCKGTEAEGKFPIFHGGLSQFHTPAAQAYMAPRGYANRQMSRADDKGDCEHKPAKKQRKDTNEAKPCHRSLVATHELLMDSARAREQLVKPSA
jgi:hypothetical protein